MTSTSPITLYYSPQTRSTGARVLLEELGAPYDLHVLNMRAGEQRQPAYLAVNPLGKVPAIRHVARRWSPNRWRSSSISRTCFPKPA